MTSPLTDQRLNELPFTISILLGTGIFYIIYRVIARRPPLPKGTPPLIKPGAGDWPVLGSLRWFSDRQRFMLNHITESISSNFSFYFGKHHIVGLAGPEGKKTFFESKHLDFGQGFVLLLLLRSYG
jgi:sterol 14-demethylase